jgi:hypothetical protein
MKRSGLILVLLWAALSWAQEVHVTPGKNGSVSLSVSAQQTYSIMTSEKVLPTLSVICAVKNKKGGHLITFTANGMLTESDIGTTPRNGEIGLTMVINGTKQDTTWIPYSDVATFAYYGKTEPERAQFLRQILSSPTITFEFTPFLTGTPERAVFDLTKLSEEVNRHPECGMNQ